MGQNLSTKTRDGTVIAFAKLGKGPSPIIVDGAFCYREKRPATQLARLLAQSFVGFTYDRRGSRSKQATLTDLCC
jgi:hypothetical protein